MTCPSCLGQSASSYSKDKNRSYFLCPDCSLVFVPRSEVISLEKEKARYDAHENNEDDKIYRDYLGKIVSQISPYLKDKSRGLDFGCGRTKLLEELFRQEGIELKSYDLFYHPDESVLDGKYDFIIMSEVIEHLREPTWELERLRRCLNPMGKLFIKTRLRPAILSDFDDWFYKRDITHIQFFSLESFKVLGKRFFLEGPLDLGDDLYLFSNNA